MAGEASSNGPAAPPSLGPTLGSSVSANKAELVRLRATESDVPWGAIHFYRDGEDASWSDAQEEEVQETDKSGSMSEDYTTLCIPCVPAYMSPGDFLNFLGEKWREDVSHCRLVMTSKTDRYLALLKFRDAKRAKEWRQQSEGRIFNNSEPQTCHAIFVKRISFKTPAQSNDTASANGPAAIPSSSNPFPLPTPILAELPTCPVCLEKMVEADEVMTIPCSHIFHSTCLQNWKGAGCPVCRFTNASLRNGYDPDNPFTQPFGSSASNLCSTCDCVDDLWICLICGHVGCGRYKGAHAKDHWKETAHSFALELETQYVWDYAGDMWVHRMIRDKGDDGKVVDTPSDRASADESTVSREKLESIGLEYTHLIASQLESQRAYYEDMLGKAVDKASKASAATEAAERKSSATADKLKTLEEQHHTLKTETVPQLEKDLERERGKATKSQDLARKLTKSVQEEKRINEGLMKRIEYLNSENESILKRLEEFKVDNADLKEMNRDLSMYITGQEKLKEMEKEGQVAEGEVEAGTASVPEKKGKRKGRK